jgi:hypothetical protein
VKSNARPAVEPPAAFPARPLAHLLLVAGARGAGKSTFVEAVRTGRMDPAILARLPRNTALWPLVEAQHHAAWMPRITVDDQSRIQRLILHCDLVTMGDASLEPALDALTLARKVTAVSIKPDIGRLAVQFSARTSRRVAKIATGEFVSMTGPPDRAGQMQYVERMRNIVLELYSEPNWVDRLYADWNARVARLAAGASLRLIEVRPLEPGPSGEFRWVMREDSAARQRRA